MDTKFLTAAAAVALMAGVGQASASVIIDSFVTEQKVEDLVSGAPGNGNQVVAPSAIGGFRDLYVQKVSGGTDGLVGTRATTGGGILSFSNDSLVRGFGCITWDGASAAADCDGVDTNGLGGYDLLADGPGFDFDVIQVDAMLEFTMRVWDTMGGFSDYFETIPEAADLVTFLPFGDFVGDADFSDVGAIQIFVNAPVDDLDASIGEISVVPVPAAGLMLLGGLGGLGALGARRRKKA